MAWAVITRTTSRAFKEVLLELSKVIPAWKPKLAITGYYKPIHRACKQWNADIHVYGTFLHYGQVCEISSVTLHAMSKIFWS